MDALQKSTEETNLLELSYLATAKLQFVEKDIEEKLYEVLTNMKRLEVGKEVVHAININNEQVYELVLRGDIGNTILVLDIEIIDDVDVYLDHILAGTYSVCKS